MLLLLLLFPSFHDYGRRKKQPDGSECTQGQQGNHQYRHGPPPPYDLPKAPELAVTGLTGGCEQALPIFELAT